jgi:hypothetical protein
MTLVSSVSVFEKAQIVTFEGVADAGYSSGRYDGVEAPPNGGRNEDEDEDGMIASGCPRYFLVDLYSAMVGGWKGEGEAGGVAPNDGASFA